MSDDANHRRDEAERWWKLREASIQHSKDYGFATLRTLGLINAGAVIALLTFFSNIKPDGAAYLEFGMLKWAIVCYIGGLVLAIVAGTMGYFNFMTIATGIPGPAELQRYAERGETLGWENRTTFIRWTSYVAVSAAILSLILFTAGSFLALQSLAAR